LQQNRKRKNGRPLTKTDGRTNLQSVLYTKICVIKYWGYNKRPFELEGEEETVFPVLTRIPSFGEEDEG